MILMLDTNAYTAMKKGHIRVAKWIRSAAQVYLSYIVIGELIFGFRNGTRYRTNLADLDAFLTSPFVSPVSLTQATAHRFGLIATQLRKNGTPIPTNDIWLAAQAMETGAELLSFDPHFSKVEGLAWTHPDRKST